ncbi:MAG: hypothetical protein ABEN55_20970, partial [Bradymonadaceae bacterium]
TLAGSRVNRKSGTALEIKIDADLGLAPGIYDVVARASGATARKEAAIGVLPKPSVNRVGPNTACLQQDNDRTLSVSGGPFLTHNDKPATPDVEVGDYTVTDDEAVTATDCRDLGAPFGPYRACSRLEVDVQKGDLSVGTHS